MTRARAPRQALQLNLCNVFLIDTRDKKEFEGAARGEGSATLALGRNLRTCSAHSN